MDRYQKYRGKHNELGFNKNPEVEKRYPVKQYIIVRGNVIGYELNGEKVLYKHLFPATNLVVN